MSTQKFIRLPGVLEKTQLSRSLVYLMAKEGRFPRPHKLSVRASGWLLHEIDEWIAARAAARGNSEEMR